MSKLRLLAFWHLFTGALLLLLGNSLLMLARALRLIVAVFSDWQGSCAAPWQRIVGCAAYALIGLPIGMLMMRLLGIDIPIFLLYLGLLFSHLLIQFIEKKIGGLS